MGKRKSAMGYTEANREERKKRKGKELLHCTDFGAALCSVSISLIAL